MIMITVPGPGAPKHITICSSVWKGMPFYALPYHIGVWKGMEGHREGNGHKLEEGHGFTSEQRADTSSHLPAP